MYPGMLVVYPGSFRVYTLTYCGVSGCEIWLCWSYPSRYPGTFRVCGLSNTPLKACYHSCTALCRRHVGYTMVPTFYFFFLVGGVRNNKNISIFYLFFSVCCVGKGRWRRRERLFFFHFPVVFFFFVVSKKRGYNIFTRTYVRAHERES